MYDGACPYDGRWPGSRPAVFAIIIWLLFLQASKAGGHYSAVARVRIDCTCCCQRRRGGFMGGEILPRAPLRLQ